MEPNERDAMIGDTCDIHEAAKLLKVHWQTVLDLIHKGFLPAAKIGRMWVMVKSDILAYLEGEVSRQTSERMGGPRPKPRRRAASPIPRSLPR